MSAHLLHAELPLPRGWPSLQHELHLRSDALQGHIGAAGHSVLDDVGQQETGCLHIVLEGQVAGLERIHKVTCSPAASLAH